MLWQHFTHHFDCRCSIVTRTKSRWTAAQSIYSGCKHILLWKPFIWSWEWTHLKSSLYLYSTLQTNNAAQSALYQLVDIFLCKHVNKYKHYNNNNGRKIPNNTDDLKARFKSCVWRCFLKEFTEATWWIFMIRLFHIRNETWNVRPLNVYSNTSSFMSHRTSDPHYTTKQQGLMDEISLLFNFHQ